MASSSRKQFDFGSLAKQEPQKPYFNKAKVLTDLESYLINQRELSPYNARTTVRGVKYLIEHYGVTTPTQDDATRIKEDMRSRGLKDTTICLRLYDLEYLAESMGIPLKVKKPRRTKTIPPTYLSMQEARTLLDAATNRRDHAILAVLLYCGLRNSELCGTRLQDVDLKNRILYVRGKTKNKHERKAVISQECAKILSDWIEVRPAIPNNDRLFITVYGQPLTQNRLERIVSLTAKRAGIDRRVWCHSLRHVCASNMLRMGIPITEVAIQLGHRSLQSTMIYLHGDLEGLKQNIDKKFFY